MKLKGERYSGGGVKQYDLRLIKRQRKDRKEVYRYVNSLNVIGLWIAFVHLLSFFKYLIMNINCIYEKKATLFKLTKRQVQLPPSQ